MLHRSRTNGPPTSPNGASSMHLWWEGLQGQLLTEVSATLEILNLPEVDRLYFWALQVSFVDERRISGSGHIGLQWHPHHPEGRAVNWGGYCDEWAGGGELHGSRSDLPSALDNPNTRDFVWKPTTAYRLRVTRAPTTERAAEARIRWRGSVTDLTTETETVVRDLFARGSYLGRPVVWSEVFADCDAPAVAVRWRDLTVRTADGRALTPGMLRTSYQSHVDGGCTNSDQYPDTTGVVQRTSTPREVRHGSRIPARSRK